MLKPKMEDLFIRCVRGTGGVILAVTTPKAFDFLKRWAWGIACAALGTCLLWYAIQCLMEAGTSTNGGYVSYEDWGEWLAPAQYRRHKSGEAFGLMIFVGICAGAAYHFFVPDDPWKERYMYFMRCDGDAGEPIGALGVGSWRGPYLDAGWKLMDRKRARALAKGPSGPYVFTAGGPGKVCSQRDYLSVVRNQRRVEDIAVTVEAQCMVWAGAGGQGFGHDT